MSDLDQLRALATEAAASGATLKNIQLEKDDDNLKLVVEEAGAAFEASIPEEMQLPANQIDFETCTVAEDSSMGEAQRDWLNRYLKALIDDEDRAQLSEVRAAIESEGLQESETFKGLALSNFIAIERDQASLNQALLYRHLAGTRNGPVLLPILGIGRHSADGAAMSRSVSGSFRVSGKTEGELLIGAGRIDALFALNSFNPLISFRTAFSLPLGLALADKRTLVISRNLGETVHNGKNLLPKVVEQDKTITMSYAPVGMSATPIGAREVLRQALKPFGVQHVDDVWARIKSYNGARLFKAYASAQGIENDRLRKMVTGSLATQIETVLDSI